MTANKVIESLDDELNTCEAKIDQIEQLRPDLVLAQLQQGLRASRQELRTLATYMESLKHFCDVVTRARSSSRAQMNGNSAFGPA